MFANIFTSITQFFIQYFERGGEPKRRQPIDAGILSCADKAFEGDGESGCQPKFLDSFGKDFLLIGFRLSAEKAFGRATYNARLYAVLAEKLGAGLQSGNLRAARNQYDIGIVITTCNDVCAFLYAGIIIPGRQIGYAWRDKMKAVGVSTFSIPIFQHRVVSSASAGRNTRRLSNP